MTPFGANKFVVSYYTLLTLVSYQFDRLFVLFGDGLLVASFT